MRSRRYPLITPLASRDGSTAKDEKLVNAYGEVDRETKEISVFKRPGIGLGDAVITGNDIYGQGLFNYDGYLFAMVDDHLGYWVYVGGGDGGGVTVFNESIPAYDTLDPANPNLILGALSNGNLTYSMGTAVLEWGGRSILTKTSGKWYCEFSIDALTSGSAAAISLGDTSSYAYLTSADVGAIISLEIDIGLGGGFAYKNGVLITPGGIGLYLGTIARPTIGINGTGVITANFGASAFTYSPPSGYNAGWYA